MPPTREHTDQAEARTDLPHSASAATHVGVGQAHELVAPGLEQHALQQETIALVHLGARRHFCARLGQALGQAITQTLEITQAEQPGPPA